MKQNSLLTVQNKSNVSSISDQYSDGKAAKVWSLYMGGGNKRTAEYGPLLIDLLRKHNVKTVLDAAAGTGVDSILLLQAGFKVTSVDLSEEMLAEARREREKRADQPGFNEWEIGRGDWLDLAEESSVSHPPGGYDAVICIGNSFAHLPDPTGDQADHKRAISNFHQLLRPGGVLVTDHRNYDYILEHGTIPNTASRLYYQGGDRIHEITTKLGTEDGVCNQITLEYEIDITGYTDGSDHEMRTKQDGTQIPISKFSLSYYPHKKEQFVALLKSVFGDDAKHTLLRDYKTDVEDEYIPSYFIHVVEKIGAT